MGEKTISQAKARELAAQAEALRKLADAEGVEKQQREEAQKKADERKEKLSGAVLGK